MSSSPCCGTFSILLFLGLIVLFSYFLFRSPVYPPSTIKDLIENANLLVTKDDQSVVGGHKVLLDEIEMSDFEFAWNMQRLKSGDPKYADWNEDEIDDIKDMLYRWLRESGKWAPSALRLAFHDCVGGCDGCVDLNYSPNGGLSYIVNLIKPVFQQIFPYGPDKKFLSLADFYALFGIVAVEFTVDLNNKFCDYKNCRTPKPLFDFKYGRIDNNCTGESILNQQNKTDPQSGKDAYPHAAFNFSQVMSYFANEFGMDMRDTVAILGAHTLGGMDLDASGYSGYWKQKYPNYFMFNNLYYKFMVERNITWMQFENASLFKKNASVVKQPTPAPHWQWQGFDVNGSVIANNLDVDVVLVKQLDIRDEGGQSRCTFYECSDSPSLPIVVEYAQNPVVFLHDFICSFEIVINNVDRDLRRPARGSRSKENTSTPVDASVELIQRYRLIYPNLYPMDKPTTTTSTARPPQPMETSTVSSKQRKAYYGGEKKLPWWMSDSRNDRESRRDRNSSASGGRTGRGEKNKGRKNPPTLAKEERKVDDEDKDKVRRQILTTDFLKCSKRLRRKERARDAYMYRNLHAKFH